MSLAAKFQARYSAKRVLQLTNPDLPASTATVDTDRLEAAADDAEAEFLALAGVTYDDDNARHVAAAVLGVEWRLMKAAAFKGDEVKQAWEDFKAACDRFALTGGGRDRIQPTSSSVLTPSDETTGARPDFDRGRWRDVVPTMPGGEDDDDDLRLY